MVSLMWANIKEWEDMTFFLSKSESVLLYYHNKQWLWAKTMTGMWWFRWVSKNHYYATTSNCLFPQALNYIQSFLSPNENALDSHRHMNDTKQALLSTQLIISRPSFTTTWKPKTDLYSKTNKYRFLHHSQLSTHMVTVMVSQPQIRAGWSTEANRLIHPHAVVTFQQVTPHISAGTVPAIPLTGRGVARGVTVAVAQPGPRTPRGTFR